MDISGRRVPLDVRGVVHGPRQMKLGNQPTSFGDFRPAAMEAGAAIESRVLVPSPTCEPRATGGAIAKDLTARFPELAKAIRAMRPDALILDGEVAVCDEQLVPRFEWMRRRPRDQVATRRC